MTTNVKGQGGLNCMTNSMPEGKGDPGGQVWHQFCLLLDTWGFLPLTFCIWL